MNDVDKPSTAESQQKIPRSEMENNDSQKMSKTADLGDDIQELI